MSRHRDRSTHDAAPPFARTLPKLVGTFALEALVRGCGAADAPASADDEMRQAAQARMQQRAVPQEVVDCLLDHGRVHHDDHGAAVS